LNAKESHYGCRSCGGGSGNGGNGASRDPHIDEREQHDQRLHQEWRHHIRAPEDGHAEVPGGNHVHQLEITGPTGRQGPSGVVSTKTTDLGSVASVATGGSFVTNATQAGTISLKAGTYLVNVNAKATPNVSNSFEVFPEFFVYNQAANPSFTGDLFNVGSGSLAENNTNIDSYFSGSGVITLTSATTLHVYAFGYDSDRSAGSYTLDDLAVTATQINP
jgi:hypothetical protein